MSVVWKDFVALVLQSDLSRGVLERMAKRLPAEVSKTDAGPTASGQPSLGSPRGLSLTKKRGQKHPTEKINQALEMIRRGENPFRAAKKLGIARTTLLYHLEKVPDHEFQIGVNPVLQNIFHQIEIYYWKTKLRLIKNMFHRSSKSDEKGSTQMWQALEDVPRPPVGSSRPTKDLIESATIDDKVTFREFIVERKGSNGKSAEVTKKNLSDAGVDIAAAVAKSVTVDAETQGKEG